MQITLWDAFKELAEFQRAVDRMLGRRSQRGSHGYPPVDLIDTGDAFVLSALLPGVERDQINLSVSDTTVQLSGKRDPGHIEGATPLLRERLYGQFHKTIELPQPVRDEEINARYIDGVLQVTLPKRRVSRPRTISID